MSKNIEVEVRGPITKESFNSLCAFFEKEGVFMSKKERVLIDYSSDLQDRTKDIRIRETNGIPEIIIKLGAWGGSENREEISVHTKEGSFDNLVRVFGELGFTKGVLCIRNSMVYEYKGIEFALVEVPNHSYYFEAEVLTEAGKAAEAEVEIRRVCQELNLNIFTKEQFFSYIETLNKEANKLFEYKNHTPRYFANKEYLK